MTEIGPAGDEMVVVSEIELSGNAASLVILNQPERMNPLSRDMIAELHERLRSVTGRDAPPVLIITGAGSAFSAGGDLRAYQKLFNDRAAFHDFLVNFHDVCQLLEDCEQLTVAALNGTCVAGGLELALACDIITMAESASVGDGHLRYGQVPGAGSSQRLVRAIGAQRAAHWLLSGQLFTAAEAVEAGLAAARFPDASLLADTCRFVADMAGHSTIARRLVKSMIQAAQSTSLPVGLAHERELAIWYATETDDSREGLSAFLDRRPAKYPGS